MVNYCYLKFCLNYKSCRAVSLKIKHKSYNCYECIQADQRVLRQLIVSYLPPMDEQLKEHDIELSLITLHWFLTAFASVVHTKVQK